MKIYVTQSKKVRFHKLKHIRTWGLFKVDTIYHLNYDENGYVVTHDYDSFEEISKFLYGENVYLRFRFPKEICIREFINKGFGIYF